MPSATTPMAGSDTSVTGSHTARWPWVVALGLVLIFVFCAWQLRMPAVATANDDARYLFLAKSLTEFSYRDLYIVGTPVHAQYPPVYPLMLALAGLLPGGLDLYLVLNIALVALAFVLIFDAVRRLWSPAMALMVLAAIAVNPTLVHLSGRIMAEAAFLAISSFALWAAARNGSSRSWLLTIGMAAILAALTRSVGITLLAAVLGLWLLERRWRPALILSAASAVTVGGWLAWTAVAPDQVVGRSYIIDAVVDGTGAGQGLVPMLLSRVTTRVPKYATQILPWELPLPVVPGTPVDNVLWVFLLVVLGGLGLWGLWRRWKIVVLYLGCYGALLAVYPWMMGRFLAPVLPFVILALLVGCDWVRRRLSPVLGMGAALAVTVVIVATGVHANWTALAAMEGCDRAAPFDAPGCLSAEQLSLIAAARYAGRTMPESTVVVTAKEAVFAFYSDRRVALPQHFLAVDPAVFRARLANAGYHYLFLGRNRALEFGPLSRELLRSCPWLDVVETFPPESYLFRLREESSPDPASAACTGIVRYREATRQQMTGRDGDDDEAP